MKDYPDDLRTRAQLLEELAAMSDPPDASRARKVAERLGAYAAGKFYTVLRFFLLATQHHAQYARRNRPL